jgi:hypothetical protein
MTNSNITNKPFLELTESNINMFTDAMTDSPDFLWLLHKASKFGPEGRELIIDKFSKLLDEGIHKKQVEAQIKG